MYWNLVLINKAIKGVYSITTRQDQRGGGGGLNLLREVGNRERVEGERNSDHEMRRAVWEWSMLSEKIHPWKSQCDQSVNCSKATIKQINLTLVLVLVEGACLSTLGDILISVSV